MAKENIKTGLKKNTISIIVVVLFYTFYEVANIHFIHGQYIKIIRSSTSAICSAGEIKDAMNDIDSTLTKLISENNNNNTESLINKIKTEIDECNDAIDEYSELEVSEEQKSIFTTFMQQFDVYIESLNEITDAVSVGNMERAGKIYSNQLITVSKDTEITVEKLFDNSVSSQEQIISKLKKHKNMNDIFMYIIAAIIIFVLLGIDRKRTKMSVDLIESQEKVEKQKNTITSAVFSDVLTGSKSRMSFIEKYSKEEKIEIGQAAYFIMFNIDDFSSVNSTYGMPSGDMILNSTASRLIDIFGTEAVYRTGSDEFIVTIKTTSDNVGYEHVSSLVERARLSLGAPHKIKNGSLIIAYSIAVIKKKGVGSVDTSIMGPLKESLKQGRSTQPGAVMFTEVN